MANVMPNTRARRGVVTAPPEPVNGPASGTIWKESAIVAGLVLISVAALWPVVTCDFVNYDDHWYVTDNARVQQGLSIANIGWAFTQAVGYWDPIDLISHMLDCQLFGMHPAGHHAANLFYHVCNTAMLYLLLRWATGRRWCSVLAAVLFAIHPQNVEPVAWISGRRDVLSTCFGILALLAYVRYTARTGWIRYVPVAVLLTLSLMVKPALAPFPVLLLLLDYWPLGRMGNPVFGNKEARLQCYRLAAEKLPLFVIVLGFTVLDYLTQRRFGALGTSGTFPLAGRAANAVISYVTYVGKFFWPADLAACYAYSSAPWWKAAGAFVLLAAVTAAAWFGRKRYPYAFVGWCWYGLALSPASGLVAQIGNIARADRYTYVPMIGLVVAAAWGLDAVARRWRRTIPVLFVAVTAAVVVYGVAANLQIRHWVNSIALFQHAVAATSENGLAYEFLGLSLSEQGRDEEAITAFQEALRLSPHSAGAHNNLGSILYRKGGYGEAAGHFTEVLRGNPDDTTALYNMGLVLLAQNKLDEAIACSRRAIAIKPDFAMAHNNLGYALARKGLLDDAVAVYREALRIEPGSALVLCNMGDVLLAKGRYDDAIQCYVKAAGAAPAQRHEALNKIGNALAQQGKSDEAAAYFRQAIAANPDFALAHSNLGYVLGLLGQQTEAVAEYREALRADPRCALALNNLGQCLVTMGRPEEAADLFRRAIAIDPKDPFARCGLASIVAGEGKLEEAATLYEKALENSPSNRAAQEGLDSVRRGMRRRGQ